MDTGGETDTKPTSSSISHYVKTVVLRDWWLVRSQTEFEGKSLAVSGLPDEEIAVRVFTSTPIVKRHSAVTLETADGAYVILKGFINRLSTEKGGFTSEVFKYFLFGFPLNWEESAGRKCCDDERPFHVSSPVKTPESGCAATVFKTETPENGHFGEAVDSPAAKKSKSVRNSTKSNVGGIACVETKKKKPKTSENVSTGECMDVFKSTPIKESKINTISAKSEMCATSGVKNKKIESKTSEKVPARKANDAVKVTPTAKKSNSSSNPAKSNAEVKTKLIFVTEAFSVMQEGLKSPSVILSDISSIKKSRSGRLLLRPLEFWRNEKAVYDSSRKITGIICGTPDSSEASGVIRNSSRKHKTLEM